MRTKKTLILMLLMLLMASPMLKANPASDKEKKENQSELVEGQNDQDIDSIIQSDAENPIQKDTTETILEKASAPEKPSSSNRIVYFVAGGLLVLLLLLLLIVRKNKKKRDDDYDPDEPVSDGDDDYGEALEKLRKENDELKNQVNMLRNEVVDKTSELASFSREKNELKEQLNKVTSNQKVLESSSDTRVQNALNKMNEAQAEVDKVKTEAQAKLREANERAEKAEQNALAKFEQTKHEIEEACNKKLADVQAKVDEANARMQEAQAKVEEANQQVEAARQESKKAQENALKQIEIERQKMEEEYQDKVNHWIEDRNSVLNKLKENIKRLAGIVEQFNPDAFNGNCAKIRSGITGFANSIQTRVDSDQWKQKKLGECLQELRQECCRILDSGTDSWMNLLGRLYSYMSVSELEQKLSMEDLSFDLVSDAYVAMQSALASVGIVVMNCSPGFDSSDDPVTAKLFLQKSSIDRITNWLNDDMPVNVAVPNHGHTVYDFGQLAYVTIDNMEIHQGSVIYYNS